jgi:hypothetical protein
MSAHTVQARWLVLLALLYSIGAVIAVRPVIDLDIWWHLRTGQWIAGHGTVPHTDPFSSFGAGKPWVAYSWLFDLAIYGLYRAFGLGGVVLYHLALVLLIIFGLLRLVRQREARLPRAAAITAVGILAATPVLGPRSYLVSIACFILVLDAVLRARTPDGVRSLWLLPPLFVLWANIHIQFVYGLFVIGIAIADAVIARLRARPEAYPPLKPLVLTLAACLAATLITPYHVRLYATLLDIGRQTGVYWFNTEMVALQFRQLSDWAALGLTLAAAFALGRGPISLTLVILFSSGLFISFRSNRDVWFVVVVATVMVASLARPTADRVPTTDAWSLRWIGLAPILVALTVSAAMLTRLSPARLDAAVARTFPMDAARAVEQGHYEGPLYNHFNWGGYLIWRLPGLPVSMDGRSHVHGDERIRRSIRTWAGADEWQSDPELATAGIVIAEVDTSLASLLRLDARFDEVYADGVARGFVRRGARHQLPGSRVR